MRDTNVIALSPPPSSFHPAVISVSGCPSPRMAALRNIARPRSSRWSRYIAINRPGGAVRAKCSPISSPPRYSLPPDRGNVFLVIAPCSFFLSFFGRRSYRLRYWVNHDSSFSSFFVYFARFLESGHFRENFFFIYEKRWKMVISFFSFFLFWCSFGVIRFNFEGNVIIFVCVLTFRYVVINRNFIEYNFSD